MMSRTHIALAVAATSLILGTADPVVLSLSAIASQFPDVDTTKSFSGRILFPLSSYLEKRFAHRSITHSFLAGLKQKLSPNKPQTSFISSKNV